MFSVLIQIARLKNVPEEKMNQKISELFKDRDREYLISIFKSMYRHRVGDRASWNKVRDIVSMYIVNTMKLTEEEASELKEEAKRDRKSPWYRDHLLNASRDIVVSECLQYFKYFEHTETQLVMFSEFIKQLHMQQKLVEINGAETSKQNLAAQKINKKRIRILNILIDIARKELKLPRHIYEAFASGNIIIDINRHK